LGWGALAICALVFLVGLLRSNFTADAVVETFMIAVSLAIAAVPEGLPAVVTISLALGMREMVHRHALIRRLASVETLGSATVICSDKTGTLTQNTMTVTRMWVDGTFVEVSGSGYETEGQFLVNGMKIEPSNFPALTTGLWIGVLNNDALLEQADNNGKASFRIIGDPTEGSILVAAGKAGIFKDSLNSNYPREQEIPFDSARKRMITIHNIESADSADPSPIHEDSKKELHAIAVKGAPDVVLRLCTSYQAMDDQPKPMSEEMRQQILAANDSMTQDALRVLGLAFRLVPTLPDDAGQEALESDLTFVGLIGMIDPARPEVQPALDKARRAGIRTIMITGDYLNTARAIAESISLLRPGRRR
jgi:P-type Ca2+ transporter type 2C